jgi:hypothetical protein
LAAVLGSGMPLGKEVFIFWKFLFH